MKHFNTANFVIALTVILFCTSGYIIFNKTQQRERATCDNGYSSNWHYRVRISGDNLRFIKAPPVRQIGTYKVPYGVSCLIERADKDEI